MNNPDSKKPTYYVYGFWNIYKGNPLVVNDTHAPFIKEFNELDEALSFMHQNVMQNVNITWCITSNYESINKNNKNYDN